jgi:hypothetical protein
MFTPRPRTVVFIAAAMLTYATALARPNAVLDTRIHKRNFALTSPEKLFSSVFSARLEKSQFETQAQYNARLAKIRPAGTQFILLESRFVRYVYAAELQRLVVMARQTDNLLPVAFSSKNLGDVPMQNAFGATVDTTLMKSRDLTLVIQNPPLSFPSGIVWKEKSDLGLYMEDVGLGLPVNIAPADAERTVKNKALSLVLGFTVADLTKARRDKSGVAPTFSAPLGIAGESSHLPVDVVYLAIIDKAADNVIVSWTRATPKR